MATKRKNATIAEAVGWPIAQQVYEARADTVVCDTETCRWQIKSLTGAKTIHPVELVAQAYGLSVDHYKPPVVAAKKAESSARGW